MIELLLSLLVFCVLIYLVFLILSYLPIPEPIRSVIVVIFALIFLIYLLGHFGYGPWVGNHHVVR
jgi:heme A synthase